MPRRPMPAILGAASVLAICAGAAHAQAPAPPPAAGVVSYEPSFFANARPESAYDMVLLLPGFAFDPGQEARGYASAAGNVLIDGARPATKTDALSDILKRIPVSAVARIELIRGGAPGIDMQGHTVLANIVSGASSELVSTSDALLTKDGRVGITTRIDASRRRGEEGVLGSLYLFSHQGPSSGHGEKDRFDASGAPISRAEVHDQNPNSGVLLTGEWDTRQLGGLLRLKGYAIYGTNLLTEEDALSDASGFRQDLITSSFRTRHVELSGDFTRLLTSSAQLQLTAIQDLEHLDSGNNARQAGSLVHSGDDDDEGESIVRATLTYSGVRRWSLEAGGEGAYNFLDATSGLLIGDVPQILPSANVQVAEVRAEPFATLTWRPRPPVTVEAGIRYELSRLTVAGDAHNSASFRFPKPRVLITWSPTTADQLRLRFERVVGQLNFSDFVTTSALDQDVVTTGGNPGLQPESDWIAEAAWDRRFGRDTDLVVTVSHAVLQQVIDELPVAGLSAPGNIGDGSRDKLDVNLTLPLRLIGLPGGRFKGEGTWLRSRVTDPTTHLRRMITNDQPFTGSATITNDVPRVRSSWRIDVVTAYRYPVFRIDEIDNFRFAAQVNALWEWKPKADLALQAQIQDIGGAAQVRERLIFTGLRSTGALGVRELRDISTGPRLYLRVRKSF